MKKHCIKLTILIVFALLLSCLIGVLCTSAENTKKEPPVSSYEMEANSGYNFSNENAVTAMSYGKSAIGVLRVEGNINEESTFRNTLAYGVESGQLSFSYAYNGAFQNESKGNWHIKYDQNNTVAGQPLSGSIGKGVLILQKSYDGSTYVSAANPVVDFFGTNIGGANNFYNTAGEDVAKGVYYRIIVAYTMHWKENTLWFPDEETRECVEVYEFFVCINTGAISIHNLALDKTELPEIDGYTSEIVERGETLTDGAMTAKGFKIDKLNTAVLVRVSKDGTLINGNTEDGTEFTENGEYTVQTITRLGKTATQTIYVFNGGANRGYSTYFGDSLVSGNRVFRYGKYPSYAKNTSVIIRAVPSNIPALTGTITNLDTDETYQLSGGRERQQFNLSPGTYYADFYTGKSNVGSVYHYTFCFNVIDKQSAPYVNLDNLLKAKRVSDFNIKHYEVAYQTTGGGYIFVCFALDSYEEALRYATEIENRFVEQADDGNYYYKSRKNPNKKEKYVDKIELTEVRNYYASQNVEYNYFNAIDSFTYQTYENDLLGELEKLSLKESIRVFPSQEEKDKLKSGKIYINNFEFISAADYDVVSVSAYCYQNGETYQIEFNQNVSSQLTVTSKYRITETNIYGDEVSYDVYYMNENQTLSTWSFMKDGILSSVDVSSNSAPTIYADSVSIASIVNVTDPTAIVTIQAPNVYSFEIKCLISELKSVGFYKKGTYKLTFVDCAGNNYQLTINVSGNSRYGDVITGSTKSYTALYNEIYRNSKTTDEEIIYDTVALKEAIERPVNKNDYTLQSYTHYKQCLDAAIAVYQDQNATQGQINTVVANLLAAYDSLVLSTERTVLLQELEKFEQAKKDLYTTDSYASWQTAHAYGKTVYVNQNASSAEITAAIQSLRDAFNSLVLRGDKAALRIKMLEIQALDLSLYTPQSVKALEHSYNIALQIINFPDALQEEINSALADLESKMASLRLLANFGSLLSAIEEVKGINRNDYTTASIANLETAFNNAVAVYKNLNSTQSTVDTALNALLQAIGALVECGDATRLRAAVSDISNIPYEIYSKETIQPLLNEYNKALQLLEGRFSQGELDQALSSLITLKSALVVRSDKQDLYDYLNSLAGMDISEYSQEAQEEFTSVYTAAWEVLNSLDSSAEQIASARQSVEAAMSILSNTEAEPESGGLHWGWWVLNGLIALIALVILVILVVSLIAICIKVIKFFWSLIL